MAATVELHPLGFVVLDDFGPDERRPVMAFHDSPKPGTLIFHARMRAEQYAEARNAHATLYGERGYCEDEWDARDKCKSLARTHGRVYVTEES